MVFLYHGIWVGFFMFMAVMAALGLWKATRKPKWILSAIWLFLILGISRNLGATAICILLSSLFLFTGPRFQATFAASIALLVLFYPGSRQANLIPTHQIVSVAAFVSENRAQSLEFRIENEDLLLARAFQKPLFGWGLYSREQIFDEFGRRISISEGRWIQIIGQSGWFGYIALFSILVFPVLFLCAKRTILKPTPETFALTLIITGNLIYMIPNSTLTPIGCLVFGSLAGFLYTVGESPASSVPARPKIRYTRFPHNSFDDNI